MSMGGPVAAMKPTILIVEDEPAIAENIQYALETDGCQVECVNAGSTVLDLLKSKTIDLIILDIGLPDINGIELCRQIRINHSVPVIFLTARSDEIDRVVGLEVGGDDYVVKPFSPRELAARVRAVLRRSGGENKQPAGNPFRIDPEKREISYHTVTLVLSRYEYNILSTLLQKPGRVYSREQLMEQCWEEPEASMDRTVDAHIKNIRAKLKHIKPGADPIITHRGVGYSFGVS